MRLRAQLVKTSKQRYFEIGSWIIKLAQVVGQRAFIDENQHCTIDSGGAKHVRKKQLVKKWNVVGGMQIAKFRIPLGF